MRRSCPREMNCKGTLLLTADVFEQYFIATKGCLTEITRFKMLEAYLNHNGYNKAVRTSSGKSSCECGSQEEKKDDLDSSSVPITEDSNGLRIKHQKYIKNLLSHINFVKISPRDFYHVVGQSAWLSYQEKYKYFCLINTRLHPEEFRWVCTFNF